MQTTGKHRAAKFSSRLTTKFALSLVAACTVSAHADGPSLPLHEGDRVLFLGNGFVENDQWHAGFETRLQRRLPKLTFRYMGWSGDTVRGGARVAGYQVPQGYARLEKEVLALKPTVIFLAYGMNESFDGPDALPGFLQDYAKLLKTLAPLEARLVIVSPTFHEDLGRPFPEPTEHNQQLRAYTTALKQFAEERKLLFVDLYHPLETAKKSAGTPRLTTNGVLLTPAGYALAAKVMEGQLGLAPQQWQVHLDQTAKVLECAGTSLTALRSNGATIRFDAKDVLLPIAPDVHRLRISGLSQGNYQLKIDGQEVLQASAAAWQRGIDVGTGPTFAPGDELRKAIVVRNQLFYRRWRPYNDHSRHWGFIGGDFKLYDQEIAAQEERIAGLRAPRPNAFEILKGR